MIAPLEVSLGQLRITREVAEMCSESLLVRQALGRALDTHAYGDCGDRALRDAEILDHAYALHHGNDIISRHELRGRAETLFLATLQDRSSTFVYVE